MREGWIATTARVTGCRFQSPGLSTLAFGFQRGEKFRISFDYYADGRLYSDEFQSPKALPQNTEFDITCNPLDPAQNDRTGHAARPNRSPRPVMFAAGIFGSLVLSLVWLALLHGCS